MQLNSYNSNSYNSNTHIIRTESLVPSEFTLKALQENSFNSNLYYSTNHINRTDFQVPWKNLNHVNRIFDFLGLKLTEIRFFVNFDIRMSCVFPRSAAVFLSFYSFLQYPQKSGSNFE